MSDFFTTSSESPFHFCDVAQHYDAVFCDIWGVLHNGRIPFQSAVDALIRLRRDTSIPVVLITNSPRLTTGVQTQLAHIGVCEAAYDDIVTSGDMVRHWLHDHQETPIYWLGPERDRGVFDGFNMTLVPFDQAQAVFCTGLVDDEHERPEDYLPLLEDMLSRNLLFVSANPDEVAHRGEKLIYCAGALARGYESLGGQSLAYGKPYRVIYDAALRCCADLSAQNGSIWPVAPRILCVGDNFKTDIVGALSCGFDCVFISGGIHRNEDIAGLMAQYQSSRSSLPLQGRLLASCPVLTA